MLSYDALKDKPVEFLSLTSLDRVEFEALLPAFATAWQMHLDRQEQTRQHPRRRKAGGGRKAKLPRLEDKLFFILVYCKVYPLQTVMAAMFGMSQGQVNSWIHTLAAVLQAALGSAQLLPSREPHNLSQLLADCPSLAFLLDGTERRKQRPKDPVQQRAAYSGKKKAHTNKNNLIVNADSQQVVYLSQTVPGKTHDKKLCDQEALTFPANATLDKDTGFQGYEPDGVITFQPKKSRAGGN